MRFWPTHHASFTTSLSAKDALARLHAEIAGPQLHSYGFGGGPPPTVGTDTERCDFLGERLPDGGEFLRNLNATPGDILQANAFQARTWCGIQPSSSGANINIRMRMSMLPNIFLGLWVTALLAASATLLVTSGGLAPWSALGPLGLAVAGWFIACFSFSEDAESIERLLRANLERE